jgi:hypothetical protein
MIQERHLRRPQSRGVLNRPFGNIKTNHIFLNSVERKRALLFWMWGEFFVFFVKFSEKIFCFTEIIKKKFDDFSFEPEEICATTDCARRQEADSLFVLFLSPSRFLVDFNKRMAPPLSYK